MLSGVSKTVYNVVCLFVCLTSLPLAFNKSKRLKVWLGSCDREFSAGKKL